MLFAKRLLGIWRPNSIKYTSCAIYVTNSRCNLLIKSSGCIVYIKRVAVVLVRLSDTHFALAGIVNGFHKQRYEYMFNEHQFRAQCCATLSSTSTAKFACNSHFKCDAAYMHCRTIVPYGF